MNACLDSYVYTHVCIWRHCQKCYMKSTAFERQIQLELWPVNLLTTQEMILSWMMQFATRIKSSIETKGKECWETNTLFTVGQFITLFEVTGSYSSSYGSYSSSFSSYSSSYGSYSSSYGSYIHDIVWCLICFPGSTSYFDCFLFSCIYNTSTLPGFNQWPQL